MYTREILSQPGAFVKDRKPVFGTFAGHPSRLDIRGVERAYFNFPLPLILNNIRIKSRLSFYFSCCEYIGQIGFYDAKVFGFVEVVFWNKETGQKFVYKSFMGPRKRFVPHSLEKAATACYKKRRYIRISYDRSRNRLAVVMRLKGDSVRPSVKAVLFSDFGGTAEITSVLPSPTMRRCSARYNAAFRLRGAITLESRDGTVKKSEETEGISFFDMNRTYMKFRSHGKIITAFGTAGGKPVAFRIATISQDAVNAEKYNGNIMFYDGKVTPLPPVLITHPYGINETWVIQDTEGMVDLTFLPVSDNINKVSIMVLRTVYHTIYGNFEGTLLTSEGTKVSFKALSGIAQNYIIRL
ncbi:MAG: DUF2804 family protein [Treponema sp.]|nr:DUF2804 family protein [Treponema sp.]